MSLPHVKDGDRNTENEFSCETPFYKIQSHLHLRIRRCICLVSQEGCRFYSKYQVGKLKSCSEGRTPLSWPWLALHGRYGTSNKELTFLGLTELCPSDTRVAQNSIKHSQRFNTGATVAGTGFQQMEHHELSAVPSSVRWPRALALHPQTRFFSYTSNLFICL